MLRLSIISFLSVVFLGSASQSAIIVSGDLTGEEQEKVDNVLRTYTGPSPKYFNNNYEGPENPEVHSILLNNNLPFAEVEFLRSYFEKEQLNVKVAYVPSTIWNLHVINSLLCNEDQSSYYSEMRKITRGDIAYRERYFDFSKKLMSVLSSQEGDRNTDFFMSLANSYLVYINEHKTEDNAWSKPLIRELDKLKQDNPSILHKMIAEEMEAAENNKILLVRATNGVDLKTQIETREEFKAYLRKEKRGFLAKSESPEEALEEMVSAQYTAPEWYEDTNNNGKILDFPLESDSACQAIHNFQNGIRSSQFINSMNLSYADSFLAGYLFDSFSRKQSACSFEYYSKNPFTTLYTLHLDKNWLFSKGHYLFHLPFLETDGIFGYGEGFHPRLREVHDSLKIWPELKNKIYYHQITSDCLEIDPESIVQGSGELSEQSQENVKISQYILKASEILSQARIISSKGEILDPEKYPDEVTTILKNQKEVSTLLQEKLLEVFQ